MAIIQLNDLEAFYIVNWHARGKVYLVTLLTPEIEKAIAARRAEIVAPHFQRGQSVLLAAWAMQGMTDLIGVIVGIWFPTDADDGFMYRVQLHNTTFVLPEAALSLPA